MWINRYMIVEHHESLDKIKLADAAGNEILNPDEVMHMEEIAPRHWKAVGGIKDGRLIGLPPHHEHSGGYHAVRLDTNHLIVIGSIKKHKLVELDGHAKITILPSLHSNTPVLHHLHTLKNRLHHANALRLHAVQENHNTSDAMTHLAFKFKFPDLFPDR